MANVKEQVGNIIAETERKNLLTRALVDWRPILAEECCVYVYNNLYLAKRFDQINYQFCSEETAKVILKDNLFALLRFKYFISLSDEVDERIAEIVKSFTQNLKTSLLRVSFDEDTDSIRIKMLPDGCVAFRNGVFDFKKNDWLFKYDILKIEILKNNIYLYDPTFTILWYIDLEFEPLPIDINSTPLETFIEMAKELNKDNVNFCYELMYNMAHDYEDKFDMAKFRHLCEVMGYCMCQSHIQQFVMLIGSGQNGKNSLFDGCFTNRVRPTPTSNDLETIETDQFITGTLENKAHNIFLESSAKTYTESKMIKALTGSTEQTINHKGVERYSGYLNTKYVFAGNDQDKIKFSDNTTGFRRRLNIFEIWFKYDTQKKFMKMGDYFDTTFSPNLSELKSDKFNTIFFIYFAMYGIKMSTNNFRTPFNFTYNDWKLQYSDVDTNLKDRIEHISIDDIAKYLTTYQPDSRMDLYDSARRILYSSPTMETLGYKTFNDMVAFFKDEEAVFNYFSNNDIYISIKAIQKIVGMFATPTIKFNNDLKKIYGIRARTDIRNNVSFIRVTFEHGRLKVLNKH